MVVQPADNKEDEKPTAEKSTTITVLSKDDLVKSFLAEVSGWRYGVVWNTGHGGRIEGGKTLLTVTVKKADFEKAVDELKGKTDLKTKGGKALKYFNDSQSSKEKSENVWDIIFTQNGDTPGNGVEQLNFHIKRDDS